MIYKKRTKTESQVYFQSPIYKVVDKLGAIRSKHFPEIKKGDLIYIRELPGNKIKCDGTRSSPHYMIYNITTKKNGKLERRYAEAILRRLILKDTGRWFV